MKRFLSPILGSSQWASLVLAALAWLAPLGGAFAQQVLPGAWAYPIACIYSSALPTLASGQIGYLHCDVNGQLLVSGGGGGGAPTQTASNATDGQATQSANQQSVDYNYAFNGTTWDRLRIVPGNTAGTTDKSLEVVDANVLAAILAGTVATSTPSVPATSGVTSVVLPTPTQHSTAREVCHQFTKTAVGSGLLALTASVTAGGSTPLYIMVNDSATQPTSATNISSTLVYHYPVGVQGAALNFAEAPIKTTTTGSIWACLSTTDAPTYTAISAIGWYEGQMP